MEFSYRISEAEYGRAFRLRSRPSGQSTSVRTLAFWVFIMICLMTLWMIVQRTANQHGAAPAITAPVTHSAHAGAASLVRNFLPFFVLLGAWIFLLRRLGPAAVRRRYRKDPTMQGEFTVNITPQSITTRNTAGTSTQSGWNLYEFWREDKDIVILVMISGDYFTLSLAGLSEPQRGELRGILAQALPKK